MTVETRFGKITASKEVLNSLSLALISANERETDKGHHGVAKEYNTVSNQLFDALNKVGYYKD